jgi:FkbM family methyltransferase
MLRDKLNQLSVREIGPEATLNLRGKCCQAIDALRPASKGYLEQEPATVEVILGSSSFEMDDAGTVARSLHYGPFEPLEVQFTLENLDNGSVFVDVGANTGYYSLAVASMYRGCQVIAVEPCSWTFEILKRNIQINSLSNISAMRTALGDCSGQAKLLLNCSGREGFNTTGKPTHKYSFVVGHETVGITTLSGLLAEMDSEAVDFIKVDVEGAELNVFKGGRDLLSRPNAPTILYESQWQCTRGFGYHPVEIVKLLKSYGYDVYVLDESFGRENRYLKRVDGLDGKAVEGDDTSVVASKRELL